MSGIFDTTLDGVPDTGTGPRLIHVVQSAVIDPDAFSGEAFVGDIEWQFSDGPPGERGTSQDYLDLEEGLRDHPGCTFVFHFFDRTYDLEVTTRQTIRVRARSESAARRALWALDGNEANFGAWPDGSPVDAPIHIQPGVKLMGVE